LGYRHGGQTPEKLSEGCHAFVANTKENFDWLQKLPRNVLECVSLERVTTKLGSVKTQPLPREPGNDEIPLPKGLNYSEVILVPINGDVEMWRSAASFCCGYLCVIEDSYPKARMFDFHTATTPFRHLYDKEKSQQVKWIKYHTNGPMSQILGEELPPTPNGIRTPVFFSGKFRRFMHQRCLPSTRDVRNYRNAFNLLQGVKKACQPISKDFILDAFKEHRVTMSTPCLVNESPDPSVFKKYQEVWSHGHWGDHFNRKRKENVDGRWSRYKPVLFKPPGPAATLEWTRGEGGGNKYAYLVNEVFDNRERVVQTYIVNQQIKRMLADRGVIDAFFGRPGEEIDPFWAWPSPEWSPYAIAMAREPTVAEKRVSPSGQLYLSWRNYSPCWEEVMLLYRDDDYKNRRVMVEGCVEPIKLRTITKGPCHRKWLSQSLQREMADCLNGLWQFTLNKANTDSRLIGRLNRECEHFHRRQGNSEPLWWNSGDYKSATDSISIHHTKAALETLLGMLPEDKVSEACKRLYRAELYEQEVHYPVWTSIPPVKQVNGQLMGSVLSFPILCIINFVAYWESLEEQYGTSFKHWEVPCLIHGDDILFKTTRGHYDLWSSVITRYGLKKSVGKNYFHPRVFTIDSELWIEGSTSGQASFKKFVPINCGSLLGSKVDGRTDYQKSPLWDKFNSSIRGAQDKERFLKQFLCFNRSILKPMTWTKSGILNLFLPHMRGGLGFELPWKADQIPLKEDSTPLVRLTKHQTDLAAGLCASMCEWGPLKSYAIIGVEHQEQEPDEKRYRLPFKEVWQHEASYPREIPNEIAEPILSTYPKEVVTDYRIRKPNLVGRYSGLKRFRLCTHPPISCPKRQFKRVGGEVVHEAVNTFPTEIWSFPYVRTRVLEPEVFWSEVVWAARRLYSC
jgi:hypothetical protein